MSATDSDRSTFDRLGADANNVLLVSTPTAPDDDGCNGLLSVEPQATHDFLFVAIEATPDDRLAAWRSSTHTDPPGTVGFVSAGDTTRSAASASTEGPRAGPAVRTVSDPADLADLGITVDALLAEWDGDGNRTTVCLHSITALLRHAALDRVFRFVHLLSGRVRATDGFAHYHLDPSEHDQETVDTLVPLFDAVVEWDGDGWRRRER